MSNKRRSLILFVALSTIASALNYFAYPILSRILPNDQYVNITVALSLLTQMGTFMSALTALTIGLSKEKDGKEIVSNLQSLLIRAFAGIAVIFLLASPLLMAAIRTPTLYAIPIAAMIIVSIPITIISGYFNGKSELIKLGSVALLSASSQIIFGTLTALVTRSGLITMVCMALGQIVAILVIKAVYAKEDLPKTVWFSQKIRSFVTPRTKQLVVYTLLAAIAIMVINLLQIADLLIIQQKGGDISKTYTDIYIISRVVFFAGMIFIWPFLGEISLTDKAVTKRAFLKLSAVLFSLTLAVIIGLVLFGNIVGQLLFGNPLTSDHALALLTLSVVYKTFYLFITAVCLYQIVLRHQAILWLTFFTALSTIAIALCAGNFEPITTLVLLTTVAGLSASACVALLLYKER